MRSIPQIADFYCASTYGTEDSVGYLMRRVVSSIAQGVDKRLEAVDLTHAQWMPLLKLSLGHASTVAELARACQVDAGAMTRMLDRLEGKGLLRRVRSTEDRRVVNIELTPDGVEAAKQIPAVLCEVQNEHLAGVSRTEWLALQNTLRRMLANSPALPDAAPEPAVLTKRAP